MIGYLTLILGCQLAGELLVRLAGLAVPGPVVGMAILFVGLVARGGLPADLGKVADGLIGNLALMFVPAGVGVVVHAGLIGREWLAISVALVVSTVLTVAATGLMMRALTRGGADGSSTTGDGDEPGAPA
ncbi:MAG: CidA/LrgA family protein [Rhizobiales bacterium]|nr:CidA/LrgA family protein [Hyphomicrobiales bacterium]